MVCPCPYRPVPPRASRPHVHQYGVETMTDDPGVFVLDCACGDRRRVRKGAAGAVVEELGDALVPSGSSLENAIFLRQPDGRIVDRWAFIH